MTNLNLSGATRLNIIIGDPIAQVKSPGGITAAFAERGHDGVLVPVQIDGDHLKELLAAATQIGNLDGIIVTVPHKFACFEVCASATERARLLSSVNIMRRRREGGWHGDHVDGLGFVAAVRANAHDPSGKRALLVGAGGAGSAIALALVEAGIRALAIHDPDTSRRDQLIAKLKTLDRAEIGAGSDDPTGFELIANASPLGMNAADPLPIDVRKLKPGTFVGCVVTSPALSPLIAAARHLGCPTSTGIEMYQASQETMVDFLLACDGS